jgi:hypothetical protein
MVHCNRESFLDDEIMEELHVAYLSDAPSDCESDDNDFGPSTS